MTAMAARSVPGSVLYSTLVVLQLIVSCTLQGAEAATFNIVNKCPYDVYVGSLPNPRKAPQTGTYPVLERGGFGLQASGGSKAVTAPADWQGRFWGRTNCKFDTTTKQGTCETGDCGKGVYCDGSGGKPPVTLVEILLGPTDQDFYDISLVDGYNVPVSIAPQGGTGKCTTSSCPLARASFVGNPNICDPNFQIRSPSNGAPIACKSACLFFHQPQYCCTGANNQPKTCPPTKYSQAFKQACPQAYSYAYDDKTSTFTCKSSTYVITFCP